MSFISNISNSTPRFFKYFAIIKGKTFNFPNTDEIDTMKGITVIYFGGLFLSSLE